MIKHILTRGRSTRTIVTFASQLMQLQRAGCRSTNRLSTRCAVDRRGRTRQFRMQAVPACQRVNSTTLQKESRIRVDSAETASRGAATTISDLGLNHSEPIAFSHFSKRSTIELWQTTETSQYLRDMLWPIATVGPIQWRPNAKHLLSKYHNPRTRLGIVIEQVRKIAAAESLREQINSYRCSTGNEQACPADHDGHLSRGRALFHMGELRGRLLEVLRENLDV